MALPRTYLSLDAFLALPEEKPALEYLHGEVNPKVSPQGQHSVLTAELTRLINEVGRPGKRALAFPELRVPAGDASLVPDIAIYRWAQIPRDEHGNVANVFPNTPDAVVEIASPGQSVNELVRKCVWYGENGVALALLVDPADCSVLAFRPGPLLHVWRASDSIDFGSLLPDFRLSVDELFAYLQLD